MKVIHIVGARPNFIKAAPLMRELQREPSRFQQILVHTGQHYDDSMSKVFFDHLEMPEVDEYLAVGSDSHAQQTAKIMMAFEPVLEKHDPDMVIVYGDVNSTIACALVAGKKGVAVAHVEAGLRSGDRTMPEEINRILTDQVADVLFTPSSDANDNLAREGIPKHKTHLVGNIMIDSLVRALPIAAKRAVVKKMGLEPEQYALCTLHRPSNVDVQDTLSQIMSGLTEVAAEIPVVFPVHPRTRMRIEHSKCQQRHPNLLFCEPMGYLDFLALTRTARFVLTDSGGMQEETTYLGIPCLTIRPNTERPITIEKGTNRLVRSCTNSITFAAREVSNLKKRNGSDIPLWDGSTALRIAGILRSL